MFNLLEDGITWIEKQTKFSPKTDLERMAHAYKLLNLDFSNVKKIHVAGTNGKGSVTSYIANFMTLQGHRVGIYQSPYIIKFNERIMIDQQMIDDDILLQYINDIYEFNIAFIASYQEPLSFFELITLIALKYFYDQKVNVIVMEVGIGGLLDATNILNYDLSVITSIGYDHMKQLGNTLESIALNKLGILKKGNYLVTAVDKDLHPLFSAYAKKVGATVEFVDEPLVNSLNPLSFILDDHLYVLGMRGIYQVSNACCAIAAVKHFYPNISYEVIFPVLKHTQLFARFHMIEPQIYIDGAHNISAMKVLVDGLKLEHKKIYILFSALADKDIKGMLLLLETISTNIVVTSFSDARFQSLEPFIHGDMIYESNSSKAYLTIKNQLDKDSILVITGSLHFASYMYKVIEKLNK
ncbi:MAG: Mur ligase family protein [Acholeplasmataceae bacterium]